MSCFTIVWGDGVDEQEDIPFPLDCNGRWHDRFPVVWLEERKWQAVRHTELNVLKLDGVTRDLIVPMALEHSFGGFKVIKPLFMLGSGLFCH